MIKEDLRHNILDQELIWIYESRVQINTFTTVDHSTYQ